MFKKKLIYSTAVILPAILYAVFFWLIFFILEKSIPNFLILTTILVPPAISIKILEKGLTGKKNKLVIVSVSIIIAMLSDLFFSFSFYALFHGST